MNNREQEEPKKCSCPYCPGHGEHYGATGRVLVIHTDEAGDHTLRQMELDFTPIDPTEPTE